MIEALFHRSTCSRGFKSAEALARSSHAFFAVAPCERLGTGSVNTAADADCLHRARPIQSGYEQTRQHPIWLKLVYASETTIRRHLKIRAEANPFDPDWHEYFEERAFFKKFGIHRHEAGIKPS